MNGLNLFLPEKLLVIAVVTFNAQRLRLGLGHVPAAFRQTNHVDRTQTPQRLDVRRTDESRADDANLDFLHVTDSFI